MLYKKVYIDKFLYKHKLNNTSLNTTSYIRREKKGTQWKETIKEIERDVIKRDIERERNVRWIFFLTKVVKLSHLINNQEHNIYNNFITILEDSNIFNHA